MAVDLDAERLTWIDVESTGLDPHDGERLLQVAAIVTDGRFEPLHEGFMAKIHYTEAQVASMKAQANDYVRAMHEATGLWDSLPTEGLPLDVVERDLLAYLKQFITEPKTSRLGGNSITLDRNFLNVNLPGVLNFLHYRNIDMSSVAGFFELTRPEIPFFEKGKSHDALDDIRESIAEAKHYAERVRALTHAPIGG